MLPKWPSDGSRHKNLAAVSEDLLGGTEKAEDAKLPGAEIGPKPCPGNERQKKGTYRNQ